MLLTPPSDSTRKWLPAFVYATEFTYTSNVVVLCITIVTVYHVDTEYDCNFTNAPLLKTWMYPSPRNETRAYAEWLAVQTSM